MEAKWALVLDELDIVYEYEQHLKRLDIRYLDVEDVTDELEGLLHRDGFLYYLPDFYLPELGIYLEIKGKEPTKVEEAKAKLLSINYPVIMLCGGIPTLLLLRRGEETPEKGYLYTYDDEYQRRSPVYLASCLHCGKVGFRVCNEFVLPCCDCIPKCITCLSEDIEAAYNKAYYHPFEDIEGDLPYPNLRAEI